MKKLLALVLALVMVMGLSVVSTNAAFTDEEKIDHNEAVEVLTSLKVINGMGDGSFNPTGDVTRAQMAKMIAIILLGADVQDSAFTGTKTDLTDINGHWGEGFIKFCVSQKIVAGYGDGTFLPDKNVTTAEAAKMLLTALGYNAEVQEYTGSNWSTNVIRDAQYKKLFEDLSGMKANEPVNRDQAAQMIYNTIQRGMIIKEASQERYSDGTIRDSYVDTDRRGAANDPITLLEETFDGQVWLGIYAGNYYTDSTGTYKDCIQLTNGALEANYTYGNTGRTVTFKSDLGIENIGEQVKVIFKDSTNAGGTAGRPDTTDTIYGAYNTKALQVLDVTKAKIDGAADQTQLANGKVKIDGTFYDVAAYGTTGARPIAYVNSMVARTDSAIDTAADGNGVLTSAELAAYFAGLTDDTSDSVKFIFNTDGEVAKVAVVNYTLNKVTAANATSVAVQGIGSQKYEDGVKAYDGVAVDDVVVYHAVGAVGTGTNGYYVIEKAQVVEGEITGYTMSTVTVANTKKVTIDTTKYDIYDGDNTRLSTNITDDAITNASLSGEIGTKIAAYMINGMVGAIKRTSDTVYHYALVLDTNGNTTAGLNTGKVQLLEAGGEKKIYEVYKDSTYQASNANVVAGSLIKYSVRADEKTIEIKDYAVASTGAESVPTSGATPYANTAFTAASNFYTKSTKVVNEGSVSGVATSDCILFVKTGGTTYKAYNVRTLSNITNVTDVAVFVNGDGQIVAAYADNSANGDVSSAGTNYGYVTGANGIVKLGDDEYRDYDVWTGSETIKVYSKAPGGTVLAKNNYIAYGTVTDNKYDDTNNLVVLSAANGNATDVATKKWDTGDKTLTYYTSVSLNGTVYEGDTAVTAPMASDVKVIYVNRDDSAGVSDFGVTGFDSSTGYANAKIVFNTDNEVSVLFVETSGECDINGQDAVAGVTFAGTTGDTDFDASLANTITAVGQPYNGYYRLSAASVRASDTGTDISLAQDLYIAPNETLRIDDNLALGAKKIYNAGQLIVTGNLTGGANLTNKGTLTVTGNVDALTQVAGTATISGNLTTLTDATAGTVNVTGNISTITKTTPTASVTIKMGGAVTTITALNTGVTGTTILVGDFTGATLPATIPASSTVQIGNGTNASKAKVEAVTLANACKLDIQANGELDITSTSSAAADTSAATISALANGAKIKLTQDTNNIVLSTAQAQALYFTSQSKTVYADNSNSATITGTGYNGTYTWDGTQFAS